MQEMLAPFTTVMTWLILLMSSVGIVLLGLSVQHLQRHRCRALIGVILMALVLAATATCLVLLAAHHSQHSPLLSQLLLPLVSALLMASLSRLSFPSPGPSPASASPGCGGPSCLC